MSHRSTPTDWLRLSPPTAFRTPPTSSPTAPTASAWHETAATPPAGPRSRLPGSPNAKGEQVTETMQVAPYFDAETHVLSAFNGVDYAYRATGASDATPLVTLQHFRGNLDNWDPALIDALARGRRAITFDNRGVAASSGTTPSTVAQMALDAIDFIEAVDVGEVDLLGFSIGSFVAQEIALVRPSTVRKVVLASSAPQGASGMHGWAPEVIGAVGKPETSAADYLAVFFTDSDTGRA